jgi:hypothetical protein
MLTGNAWRRFEHLNATRFDLINVVSVNQCRAFSFLGKKLHQGLHASVIVQPFTFGLML